MISSKLKDDFHNFVWNNDDTDLVLSSNYFSAYKRTFVLKLPIGTNAFSFGIIVIGRGVRHKSMVMHEYGHKLQLKKYGLVYYLTKIAIPSVTANILSRKGKLPYDYYGSRWEAEADQLAGVIRKSRNKPWPEHMCRSYKALLKLFWK